MNENRLQTRWAKEDEAALDAAVSALLQHEHGRKFLWWLLTIGKVGQQPMHSDPHMTSFNCGELNVGQQVLARITSTSPEGYVEMIKEMADARRTRDTELANARDAARAEPFGDASEPE